MANPISKAVTSFGTSAERDAIIAACGAAVGTALIPFMPQLPLGKYSMVSNLIYGSALVAVGMHIKIDGVGYFLIGMGVVLAVDGIVRVIFPKLANVSAPSFTQIKMPAKNVYGGAVSLNV